MTSYPDTLTVEKLIEMEYFIIKIYFISSSNDPNITHTKNHICGQSHFNENLLENLSRDTVRTIRHYSIATTGGNQSPRRTLAVFGVRTFATSFVCVKLESFAAVTVITTNSVLADLFTPSIVETAFIVV